MSTDTTNSTQTVLITGASSGIGAGLAREFVRRGYRVALVARRLEKLEVLAGEIRALGGMASAHRGDVTVDGSLAEVIAELARQGVSPGIVVANAGFGVVGNAQKLTLDDYRRQFETNVFGVIRTLHETLPALKRMRGRFVIMGSVAGHLSGAGSSPYAMSKFAVRALAEALHADLRSAGVSCTLISPGFVDSDIRRVDNRGGLHDGVADPVPSWLRVRTDKAARAMARGILRGRREVIVTLHGRAIIFFARHFPRFTRWALLRGGQKARPEPDSAGK
ncbi:MAG TPA: SDR family NAD(P)-dependent oxidoreductase [Steroidobacteraceae bacterium]|nr:SDR family NAD(P)-dependent oxidoreductase [Steroidobacteraceae bacterium]